MLGVPEGHKMVLFVFGAHALTLKPAADWLPPNWMCIACTGGKPLSVIPSAKHTIHVRQGYSMLFSINSCALRALVSPLGLQE